MAKDTKVTSDFRDASIDASMPLVAKALAHLLANASPDVLKSFFGGKTILGIPSEIATALGGGGVGLFLAKAIEHFYPGMDPKTKDRVMDLAPMVAAEYNRIAQTKSGSNTTVAGGGVKAVEPIPDAWVSPSDPTTVYIDRCPYKHHLVEVQSGKRKNKEGVDANMTKFAPRNGFISVEFEAVVASGANPPSAPEPGCACRKLFAQDRAAFNKQQAEKAKAEAEAAKPKKPFFRPETVARFDRFADGTFQGVSDVFHGIDQGIRGIGNGIKAAAVKGEEFVAALPGEAKELDARVTASAEKFAKNQEHLLEIERYARKHNLKNVKAFKAWVLERNIVDLENKLHISEMQRRFGVRS